MTALLEPYQRTRTAAATFWRRVIIVALAAWVINPIAAVAARDKAGELLWDVATKFVCQCFCARSEYVPSKKNRFVLDAESTLFGRSSIPLPIRSLADLDHWLRPQSGLYDVRYKRAGRKGLSRVWELAPGVLLKAPPTFTLGEREQALDKLTQGAWLKLKQQAEVTHDEAKQHEIQASLRALAEKQGVDLEHAGGEEGRREVILYNDLQEYRPISRKKDAWAKKCAAECKKTAIQDPRRFWFQEHVEFAMLKRQSDPYNEGRYFSDEPVHAIAMGVPSILSESANAKYKAWMTQIGNRFGPLLEEVARGSSRLPACSRLGEMHFELSGRHARPARGGWSQLFRERNTVRNPNDFYPPTNPRSLAQYTTRGGRRKQLDGAVLGIRTEIFNTRRRPPPPKEVAYDDEMDYNATPAIGGWLQSRGVQVAAWPAQTVQMVGERLGAEWRMRAVVELAPEKRRSLLAEVTSLWKGQPIAGQPNRISYLHVFVSRHEAEVLSAAMKEILIHQWASQLVTLYNDKGMEAFAAVTNHYEHDDEEEEGAGQDDENDDGDSGSEDDDGSKSSKTLGSKKSMGHKSAGSSKSAEQSAFLELQRPRRSKVRPPLASIEFIYVGSVWLACWHHRVNPSAAAQEGSLFDYDNRLFLAVNPKYAILRRTDGVKVKVPLKSAPAVVGVMSDPKAGIFHADRLTKIPEFWSLMNQRRGRIARPLAEVLMGYFRVLDKDLLRRNTCELDTRVEDLQVGDAMPSTHFSIYHSGNPAVKDRRNSVIEGEQMRGVCGNLLIKCYNAVPPSGTVLQRISPTQLGRKTCTDVPAQARFAFVEITPLDG